MAFPTEEARDNAPAAPAVGSEDAAVDTCRNTQDVGPEERKQMAIDGRDNQRRGAADSQGRALREDLTREGNDDIPKQRRSPDDDRVGTPDGTDTAQLDAAAVDLDTHPRWHVVPDDAGSSSAALPPETTSGCDRDCPRTTAATRREFPRWNRTRFLLSGVARSRMTHQVRRRHGHTPWHASTPWGRGANRRESINEELF